MRDIKFVGLTAARAPATTFREAVVAVACRRYDWMYMYLVSDC